MVGNTIFKMMKIIPKGSMKQDQAKGPPGPHWCWRTTADCKALCSSRISNLDIVILIWTVNNLDQIQIEGFSVKISVQFPSFPRDLLSPARVFPRISLFT